MYYDRKKHAEPYIQTTKRNLNKPTKRTPTVSHATNSLINKQFTHGMHAALLFKSDEANRYPYYAR